MSRLALKAASYSIDGKSIVEGLDISADSGQVTAIVGPNGAGKSTALKLLTGLLTAHAGRAVIDTADVASLSRQEVAKRVTYVPQDAAADVAFTVRECVSMGRYCHRGRFAGETSADHEAIDAALAITDTTELADRWLNELSGGETQRVMLARGLATQSRFLLLDEPTANLDIDHELAILDLCKRLATEGRGIVLALHDLNSVFRVADTVYVLSTGRLAAAGEPTAVLTEELLAEVFRVQAEFGNVTGNTVLRFERKSSPR